MRDRIGWAILLYVLVVIVFGIGVSVYKGTERYRECRRRNPDAHMLSCVTGIP